MITYMHRYLISISACIEALTGMNSLKSSAVLASQQSNQGLYWLVVHVFYTFYCSKHLNSFLFKVISQMLWILISYLENSRKKNGKSTKQFTNNASQNLELLIGWISEEIMVKPPMNS